MDSCPNEILDAILQWLEKTDLFTLRLVGTRLRDVATRPAFASLKVYETELSARKFSGLAQCDNSSILHAVETVMFDGNSTDYYELGAEPSVLLLKDSFSSLTRFPNLQNLDISFLKDSWPGGEYSSYFVDLQLEIWRSLQHARLPRLRKLSIDSMLTHFPRILDKTDPFLALFRSLDSLSLSLVPLLRVVDPDLVPQGIFKFDDTLTHMLTAARNITSLELGLHDFASPRCEPFAFETLVFPALTALSLHDIMFQGAPDPDPNAPPSLDPPLEILDGRSFTVEAFIRNHGATLQHLGLYDCAAVSAPSGGWACVFKRFGAQLPELVEFAFRRSSSLPELQRSSFLQEHKFLYAHELDRHRYIVTVLDPDMSFVADDPADVAALDRLQTAVMFRRNRMPFDPVPSAGLKSRFRSWLEMSSKD